MAPRGRASNAGVRAYPVLTLMLIFASLQGNL